MMQAFEGIRVLDLTIWQLTSPVNTRPAQAHNRGGGCAPAQPLRDTLT